MECIRLTVRGLVQGVGFRAFVRAVARDLGVTGWVRNRADGSVEVMACGPEASLRALTAVVAKGPALARVTGVEKGPAVPSPHAPEGFVVRYDED